MAEANEINLKDPLVVEAIAAAVATQVEGLKANRDEILLEKKTLLTKLETFKDIDPEQVKSLMEKIGQSEDAKLIADGKLDELIEKRTSVIREAAEGQVTNLTKLLDEVTGKFDTVTSKYNSTQISTALQAAAIKAKVRAEAISDVIMRGSDIFTLADDGVTVEARNAAGELVKDGEGLILNPDKFLTALKKTAPHYWQDSTGAGVTNDTNASDLQARIDAAAASGDMTAYRKLREQKKTASK